jgi:hypothetical protein
MNLARHSTTQSTIQHLPQILAGAAGWVAGLAWWVERAGAAGGPGPAGPAIILLLAVGTLLALNGGTRPLVRSMGLLLGGLAGAACLGSLLPAGPGAVGLLPALHRLAAPTALALLAAASALLLRWAPPVPSWATRQGAAALALLPMGAGTLGVLAFFSGMPLLYGAQKLPLGLDAGLGALLLGLALLGAAGSDAWPMALFRVRDPEAPGRRYALGPMVLFLVVGIGILGAGCLYLQGQVRSDRAAADLELAQVGDLKARQITQWYEERLKDGRDILRSGPIQDQLARFLAGGAQAPAAASVLEWLRGQQEGPYQEVMLLDAQGRPRLSVPEGRAADGFQADIADLLQFQNAIRARSSRTSTGMGAEPSG